MIKTMTNTMYTIVNYMVTESMHRTMLDVVNWSLIVQRPQTCYPFFIGGINIYIPEAFAYLHSTPSLLKCGNIILDSCAITNYGFEGNRAVFLVENL